jgi:hypothetical protein
MMKGRKGHEDGRVGKRNKESLSEILKKKLGMDERRNKGRRKEK